MYNNGKTSKDLWAITTPQGEVVWSRGGSSSSPRLMIYESEKKAQSALQNAWTQQVHKECEVEVRKIYSANVQDDPHPPENDHE
jgi:hypothetical protein